MNNLKIYENFDYTRFISNGWRFYFFLKNMLKIYLFPWFNLIKQLHEEQFNWNQYFGKCLNLLHIIFVTFEEYAKECRLTLADVDLFRMAWRDIRSYESTFKWYKINITNIIMDYLNIVVKCFNTINYLLKI